MTTRDSEPEPDVYVVRGELGDYDNRHPGPADTPLVVEVADSTLARDRGLKQRIYARAGVPVYWIVNLVERAIEVHAKPASTAKSPKYRQRQVFAANDDVPVVLDGELVGTLRVADILPSRTKGK